MFGKIDYFLLSLMLCCSGIVLQPLADPNDDTTAFEINFEESSKETTEYDELEDFTERNFKVSEIIQQIDIKEDGEQLINNISNIVISNGPIITTINDTNDVDLNNINTASIDNYSKGIDEQDNISVSWRADKWNRNQISPKRRILAPNNLREKEDNDGDNPNIFMLINTGNIKNISLDTKDLQLKTDTLNSLNTFNSILISKLFNSTKNNIISNLLLQNPKNIFLFLNTGNITNVHINSADSVDAKNENEVKNLKKESSSDDLPEYIDVRFRSQENNTNDNKTTNNTDNTEKPNNGKDNILTKLLPEPLDFDLTKIPVNILGTAANIFKRLKRNTFEPKENGIWTTICNLPIINETYKDIFCKNLKTDEIFLKNIFNRNAVLEDYEDCTNSQLLKLFMYVGLQEVLDSNDAILSHIAKVIMSFLEGDENVIDLISLELLDSPFPVNLELQLSHGDTKEFIHELSKYFNFIVCR